MFGLGYPELVGVMVLPLIWALIIGGLVLLVRALAGRGRDTGGTSSGPGSRAQEILDARYARGEITREQYLQMRQYLQ